MVEHSLENILRVGEDLYFSTFKNELESEYYGQYVVIDTEKKEYVVRPNQLEAIEEARSRFGDKLFFIVQIGGIDQPTSNFYAKQHSWSF